MRLIKRNLTYTRLKDNEVNFKATFEGSPNYSKTYFTDIFR